MKRIRLVCILAVLSLGMGILFSAGGSWAGYPEKEVTYIVVFGAGGGNDVIARKICDVAKKYFPKPLVVVNRPGAGGSVGTVEIIQASPDGYTIGQSTMTPLTIQPHRLDLPYNTPDDYTPLVRIAGMAFFLEIKSDEPWKTLNDLVEYARGKPGEIRVGHYGIGHLSHLIIEELESQAKIKLTTVPYRGGGDAVAALLGGHVEAIIGGPKEVLPYVKANKTRALAVCDQQRHYLFPQVPTFKELGYDIDKITYSVIIGPKGLPNNVILILDDTFEKVSKDAEFVDFMKKKGMLIPFLNSKDVKKVLWQDYRWMDKVLDRLGLKKK